MNKTPRKSKQWAKEAYDALDVAWGLLRENTPVPTEDEKINLIDFAPPIAAVNRGISDKDLVAKAYSYALESFLKDYNNRDISEPINFSICFLLAYLDSQVSFGFITLGKAEDAMSHLNENFDMSFEGDEDQKNTLIAVK